MKKIINGKKYDTNTAKVIHRETNGKFQNDCWYAAETLYKKKTGEYFLEIERGGYSRFVIAYTEQDPHYTTLRIHAGIMPLSEREAKEWSEEAMTGSEYEELFGEVGE